MSACCVVCWSAGEGGGDDDGQTQERLNFPAIRRFLMRCFRKKIIWIFCGLTYTAARFGQRSSEEGCSAQRLRASAERIEVRDRALRVANLSMWRVLGKREGGLSEIIVVAAFRLFRGCAVGTERYDSRTSEKRKPGTESVVVAERILSSTGARSARCRGNKNRPKSEGR